ncbi:MAG TPA: hypothetical protein VEX43_18860 [Chthoniobacterales bacterium]|nr:hypothetical protein [Chthoniobacterales bacterium]
MVTSRRYWVTLSALVIICAAGLAVAWLTLYPVCHLGIIRAPEVVASRGNVEPSKNLAIWNGSYHGPDYEDYSKICNRCWMAYHPALGFWERASEVPDAFHRPLRAAIRNVPLPPADHVHFRVVYTQRFRDHQFSESVAFWCDDIPTVLQPLRDYAAAHNLFFGIDEPARKEGQRFVCVETNPPTI